MSDSDDTPQSDRKSQTHDGGWIRVLIPTDTDYDQASDLWDAVNGAVETWEKRTRGPRCVITGVMPALENPYQDGRETRKAPQL